MRPIKFSELLPDIAGSAGQSLTATDTVLRQYWREVRGALSRVAHPRVQVANLGTFNLKPTATERRLSRRRVLVEKMTGTSPRQVNIRSDAELEIAQLEKATTFLAGEKDRKVNMKRSGALSAE